MLRPGDRIVARRRACRRAVAVDDPARRSRATAARAALTEGCRAQHARAADRSPRRAGCAADPLSRVYSKAGRRMLIGFDFGEAPKPFGSCAPPRAPPSARCGTSRPRRSRASAARSPAPRPASRSTASSASPRMPMKRSSPAPATRSSSSASSRWSWRSSTCSRSCRSTAGTCCGRSPRRCAGAASRSCDVPLQLGGHRAAAVPGRQRHQQRHRPPRRLTAAPGASARRGRVGWRRTIRRMASKRQIHARRRSRSAGGAPVAVQTMTKTETANFAGDDGADPHGRRRRARTSCAWPCPASRTPRR